jgi:hypothetical protein
MQGRQQIPLSASGKSESQLENKCVGSTYGSPEWYPIDFQMSLLITTEGRDRTCFY